MLTHWKFWLGLALLAGLLWLVEDQYGWQAVLSAWQAISPIAVAGAVSLMLVSYVLRAIRFYDFFKVYCQGQFALLLRITVLHNFFNNLLPMRSGEATFPVLMKQHFQLRISHSGPALLWLRLLDLYALVALAGISLSGQLSLSLVTKTLLALALLTAPLLLLPLQNHIRRYLSQHSSSKVQKLSDLMAALPDSPAAYSRALFWTLTNWALKLAVYAWLLAQFVPLTWPQAWTGVSGGELSSVLPIHGFAGAGTYEAGIVAALLPWPLNTADVLAAAVNLHLFVLGTTLVLTGLIAAVIRPASPKPE